jgi:CHAD domain-containing protein
MASALAPDTLPDAALRQIVAECRSDLLKHRAVVLKSTKPEGIHQTRVALRRLRAVLGLFAGAVDGADARAVRSLSAEARWLAGECAPARDLHVFLTETVENVPPEVKRVANRVARSHLERARTALGAARFTDFDRQLAAFTKAIPPVPPVGRLDEFGRKVLDQRHAKVGHRGHRIEALDVKHLHRLRIAIKKLRYAATFLRPTFAAGGFDSPMSKAYIDATERLQSALGALNDREVAEQMIADIAQAARPTEAVDKPLAKLARQAASGNKRRRQKLERAWKRFRKTERFWCA